MSPARSAGATRVFPQGYVTTSVVKSCTFVPPTQTFTVSVVQSCPFGFQLDPSTVAAQNLATGGSCAAVAGSATSVTATCNFLDGPTCRLVASCVAL